MRCKELNGCLLGHEASLPCEGERYSIERCSPWGLGLRPWNKFTQEMRAAFDMSISIWGKLLCLLNSKCIMHSSHAVKFFPLVILILGTRKIHGTSSSCHLASCISGRWSGSRWLIISRRAGIAWACRSSLMNTLFAPFFRWKGYRCFNKW